MVWSESEPETNNKEQPSTKTSKQMSISDNNKKGRKSTKSTEQMVMSESESDDEEQDTRKSTRNSEQMSMSEDESESKLVIDLKENHKSKGNKKQQQSTVVDLTVHDEELTGITC